MDQRFQRLGLDEAMLTDAAARAMMADIAAFMLVVEAKNDQASAFYRRYGFRAIASRPAPCFSPLRPLEKSYSNPPFTKLTVAHVDEFANFSPLRRNCFPSIWPTRSH